MNSHGRRSPLAAAGLLLVLGALAACESTLIVAPPEPLPPLAQGALRIVTISTGDAIEGAEFWCRLDNGPPSPMGPNAEALIHGLTVGTHWVRLFDLGTCVVEGANPVRVQVHEGQTAEAVFRLECAEPCDDCPDVH